MIQECRQEIISALASDLRKVYIYNNYINLLYFYVFTNLFYIFFFQSKFESVIMEINVVEGEIKHLLMSLKEWSADEKVLLIFYNFLHIYYYIYIYKYIY